MSGFALLIVIARQGKARQSQGKDKSQYKAKETAFPIGVAPASFIYAFQRLLPLTQQIYAASANYKYKCTVIKDVVNDLEETIKTVFFGSSFFSFSCNSVLSEPVIK